MDTQPPPISLTIQSGANPGEVFAIHHYARTIGRGIENDIVIAEPSLSRQHARIRPLPYAFVIEDLGSTNGTFVNGQRVTAATPLRPGDSLQLGNVVTLRVQASQTHLNDQETISSDATFVPGRPPAPDPNPTLIPAIAQPSPSRALPNTPLVMPVAAHYPPPRRGCAWLWIAIIAVTILLIGAIIGGLYYYLVALSAPHTAEPIQVGPVSTSVQQPVIQPGPSLTPALTATPLPTREPVEIIVAGAPALAAEEGEPPENINRVGPGCNGQVEFRADQPLVLAWGWAAATGSQSDYLAEWQEAAYYDLRLGGVPVTEFGTLRYYRTESCDDSNNCWPALSWWVNVGILPAGIHHVTLETYITRAVSDGFDVEPADGKLDVYGPGLVSTRSCDIVIAAVETPTPTPEPTPTQAPTPSVSPVPLSSAPLGIFQDFESESTWKRGDQPFGQFSRSADRSHAGSYAGQLAYNFPSPDNDYVVFLHSRLLAGRPNAISAWVHGDGSGHFLNTWIKDAGGQTWQMTFGQVKHTGWQEMTAFLDTGRPWPSGHISGPDNGVIDYPISFQSLVLDDIPETFTGSGTLYIDDLRSQEGAIPPASTRVNKVTIEICLDQLGAQAPAKG